FADLPEQAAALGAVRDLLLALRALAGRATVAELIEEACAATDFEAVCLTQFQGTRKVANVRKLIELARDWERKRFFTLRDFVRTVRRMAETEPREPEAALVAEQDDVVRLMTIHQAKGLEFRAVVVPDLGRGPKLDNRMPALDDALGVVGGPIDASGRVVTGHLGLEEHRRKELDRERAEQARLFYVACTRAEDVLVLLEGKGDARYLREEKGERHVWCHQVWEVLERARLAAFVASGARAACAPPASGPRPTASSRRSISRPRPTARSRVSSPPAPRRWRSGPPSWTRWRPISAPRRRRCVARSPPGSRSSAARCPSCSRSRRARRASSCTAGSTSSPAAAGRTSCATTSTPGRRPRRSRATHRSSARTSSRSRRRARRRSRPSWSSCAAGRWCGGCRRSTRGAT